MQEQLVSLIGLYGMDFKDNKIKNINQNCSYRTQ